MAEAVIAPGYVRTMAAYNAEMNRRVYAAASALTEAQRREDRGAFWRSLHGTLAHILWGDLVWLSRFGAGEGPGAPLARSGDWIGWEALAARRPAEDARISQWAEGLSAEDLAGDLVWFSGAKQREIATPKALCVTHLFNHQTHHRGQAHAILTAFGAATGDTDLPFVLG